MAAMSLPDCPKHVDDEDDADESAGNVLAVERIECGGVGVVVNHGRYIGELGGLGRAVSDWGKNIGG